MPFDGGVEFMEVPIIALAIMATPVFRRVVAAFIRDHR
jgi:hypothetical protein